MFYRGISVPKLLLHIISARLRWLPLRAAVLAMVACWMVIPAGAGLRVPGKYSGVVVFDQWDTCFLLSGPYITYISDRVKNELRPYAGRAMQVYASDVFQPMNPGDALIRKYKIIGPAPAAQSWLVLDGLELTAESDFGPRGIPTFAIHIRNTNKTLVLVHTAEIGPTLLGTNGLAFRPFSPSDGESTAWITRGLHSKWEANSGGHRWFAKVGLVPHTRLKEQVQVEAGQSFSVRIRLQATAGKYQFMFGYGGGVHEGKSLASKAISFHLSEKGLASLDR